MELVNLHLLLLLQCMVMLQLTLVTLNTGGAYGAGRFGYSINDSASVATATTGASAVDWG
jgi:hypothetical protein